MNIDHIVLWVSDQKRSLDFYVNVVGLDPVRAQEFAEGGAGFPSVRVSKTAIIDLMDKSKAPSVRKFTGGTDGAGGALVNHVLTERTGGVSRTGRPTRRHESVARTRADGSYSSPTL